MTGKENKIDKTRLKINETKASLLLMINLYQLTNRTALDIRGDPPQRFRFRQYRLVLCAPKQRF